MSLGENETKLCCLLINEFTEVTLKDQVEVA